MYLQRYAQSTAANPTSLLIVTSLAPPYTSTFASPVFIKCEWKIGVVRAVPSFRNPERMKHALEKRSRIGHFWAPGDRFILTRGRKRFIMGRDVRR